MKSLSMFIIFSLLLVPVFPHNTTHHHSNGSTNHLQGIQEELQLVKETVHTLVTLVNVVNNKVDSNTNNIKTLTNKVITFFKKLESVSLTVGSVSSTVRSNSKKVNTTAAKVDSTAKKLDITAAKVDSTATKVDTNAKVTDSNSKNIATLTDEVSPIAEQCRSLPTNICGGCKCRDDKRLHKKFYCDCTHLPAKRDCKQFHQEGFKMDGVYKIHQNNIKMIRIFCDQTTDGGGWAVFQRRLDGSVKFYRDWLSYKVGFGDLHHEFWLGNTNLFTLSLQGIYPSGNELRVELTDWNGVQKIAMYRSFELFNEERKFQLNVGGYSGTAGDSLAYHNGMKFTTFDQDNDRYGPRNCAVNHHGAYWYKDCHVSNLNGLYNDFGFWENAKGVNWDTFHGDSYSMKHVEMKVRRKG